MKKYIALILFSAVLGFMVIPDVYSVWKRDLKIEGEVSIEGQQAVDSSCEVDGSDIPGALMEESEELALEPVMIATDLFKPAIPAAPGGTGASAGEEKNTASPRKQAQETNKTQEEKPATDNVATTAQVTENQTQENEGKQETQEQAVVNQAAEGQATEPVAEVAEKPAENQPTEESLTEAAQGQATATTQVQVNEGAQEQDSTQQEAKSEPAPQDRQAENTDSSESGVRFYYCEYVEPELAPEVLQAQQSPTA